MTSKEAIKMLRTIKGTVYLGNRKFYDALDVAIEALKAQDMTLYTNLPEVSVEEIITSPLLTKKWKSRHRRIEP